MKLIVGLGNPGRKYAGTRHNAGYDLLDILAQRHAAGRARSAFHGQVCEANIAGVKCLLLRPETFMNRSGTSVLAARDFYKLEISDLLIVSDDFQLPLGRLRCRLQGTSGGQKGLADVIRCLGTEAVARLRIGVGPVPETMAPADFVLSRFSKAEREVMDVALVQAADAVVVWVAEGGPSCMNRYN